MHTILNTIKDRKIRIGVVGCGKIAAAHFNSLAKLADQFEVVSVCDSHKPTLEAITSSLKVDGFPTLDAMLTCQARTR